MSDDTLLDSGGNIVAILKPPIGNPYPTKVSKKKHSKKSKHGKKRKNRSLVSFNKNLQFQFKSLKRSGQNNLDTAYIQDKVKPSFHALIDNGRPSKRSLMSAVRTMKHPLRPSIGDNKPTALGSFVKPNNIKPFPVSPSDDGMPSAT